MHRPQTLMYSFADGLFELNQLTECKSQDVLAITLCRINTMCDTHDLSTFPYKVFQIIIVAFVCELVQSHLL
eukprot:m.48720 g.48720  ORF g.48720 m.48720 type:complete len:72 (+) comp11053_c0_seq4:178-393(+)